MTRITAAPTAAPTPKAPTVAAVNWAEEGGATLINKHLFIYLYRL